MRKFFLILFCLMCCHILLHAQQNEYTTYDTTSLVEEVTTEDNYNEEYDEQPVFIDTTLRSRNIDLTEGGFQKLKDRKEYAYVRNLDSLLKASQKQQKAPETRMPRTNSWINGLLGGPVIKIILWTLAFIFVGVIIYQILLSKGMFQRSSRSRVSEKAVEAEDELLLQNNFDKLVQQAYQSGDYRLAVRYLFLKTLQELKEKSHINYEPDKTNSRYVYEIPVNWRNDFSQLIFQYEYVWYGHFDIDKEKYEQVQRGFNAFIQKV